jgi:hypothetical protein
VQQGPAGGNSLNASYLFRKNDSKDFRFPYQGTVVTNTPLLNYRVAYVSDRFPPERYYIPSSPPALGARYLVKELWKAVKKKWK